MSKFITRFVKAEELAAIRIATAQIQYMESHEKEETCWYRVKYQEGQEYKKLVFKPFPRIETMVRGKTIVVGDCYGERGVEYTVEQMFEKGYIVEGDKVYRKPTIIICYGVDKKLCIEYGSWQALHKAWDNFKYRFEQTGLHFIF